MKDPAGCNDPSNDMIPWYLNGSLEGEERHAVAAHIENCAYCSEELDALAGVARRISALGIPGPAAESIERELRSPRWLAYVAAAVLLLPAVLGVYWGYLGFPRRAARTAAETPNALETHGPDLEATVRLDLGVGPLRGEATLPALTVPAGVRWVTVTFLVPAAPDAGGRVELHGPTGRVLAAAKALQGIETLGYTFPATTLRDPGEYAIVFRQSGSRESRSYRFPFVVREVSGTSS